jgi:hypothetical protein
LATRKITVKIKGIQMARRTAAERQAEAARMQELSEQARVARETEEYPVRMMSLLERASDVGFLVTVDKQQFMVQDLSNRYGVEFRFGLQYDRNSMNVLDSLEFDVSIVEAEQAEQRRLAELRNAALSKLTKEERQALGV